MRQHFALLVFALTIPGYVLSQEVAVQPERAVMTRAIEAAQARIDGGVLEVDLETEDGVLVYEIDLVQGSDVHEVIVDARTGNVASVTEQRIDGFVSGIFREDQLRAAEAAGATLAQALVRIEQRAGVRIEEISLRDEDDRWIYEVEIEEDIGSREVLIDAMTGQVVIDAD